MRVAVYEKLGFLWKYPNDPLKHHRIGSQQLDMELVLSDPSIMRSFMENGCVGIDFDAIPTPVSAHLPFYDINIASADPLHAEYSESIINEAVYFAAIRGISVGVLHLGCNPLWPKKAYKRWLPRFLQAKERIEKKAAEQHLTIAWENTYERTMDIFTHIASEQPDTKWCVDVGHINCFADFTLDNFLDAFGNNIIHAHLHDNDGSEDMHAALGSGTAPWKRLIERLPDTAVETVVLELNARDTEASATKLEWIFSTTEE